MRWGSRVRSYWRSRAKESSFGSKGVGGSREERLVSWWEESQAGWGVWMRWKHLGFVLDRYCE